MFQRGHPAADKELGGRRGGCREGFEQVSLEELQISLLWAGHAKKQGTKIKSPSKGSGRVVG